MRRSGASRAMNLILLPLFALASLLVAPAPATAAPSSKYGNARYDQWSFVTTHNSFAYDSRITPVLRNQSRSISQQLNDGVRGFMLDTYDDGAGVRLCHKYDCADTLRNELTTIVDWMYQNPKEIVTIFLQNYVADAKLKNEIAQTLRSRGAHKLLFDPNAFDIYNNNWPTLRDMAEMNRRLVIFTDVASGSGPVESGGGGGPLVTGSLLYTWGHVVETQYGYGVMKRPSGCRNRAESQPMNTAKVRGNLTPLFLLNQFNSDDWFQGGPFNGKDLSDRIQKDCASTGRAPNAVAVNEYQMSDGSGKTPKSIVDDINRRDFIYAHESVWIVSDTKQYENSRYRNRCLVRGPEMSGGGGLVTQRACVNPAPNSHQWAATPPTYDGKNHFWLKASNGNCLTVPHNNGTPPSSGTQMYWWPCETRWWSGNQLWSIQPVKVGNGNSTGYYFINEWSRKCLTMDTAQAAQAGGKVTHDSCPTPTV